MRRRSRIGFTLLEVMLALAILSASLTILMGTMATSNQQAIYANRLTRVSQLARSKLIDVEYEFIQDGFQDDVWRDSGTFDDVEPTIEWEVVVHPVEIPEDVKKQLLGKVNAQLFGGEKSQGALQGNAAFSSKLPRLIGCIPQMINRIGKKIRRVQLTLTFPFQGAQKELQLSQYIVDKSNREFGLFGTGEEDSGLDGTGGGEQ